MFLKGVNMSFFTNRRQTDNDVDKQPPKPIPQHPVGFETVLGAGSSMEGSLTTKGNVRLDGDFTGTLDIKGNVLVGETAKINANIDARNISIAGAVRGNVTGNKVQLLRTGRIWGDITANALTTEEGAFIDGKITMKSHEANRPPEPEKATVEATQVVPEEEPVSDIEAVNENDETIAAASDTINPDGADDEISE
jgi:cytoskeletal protein CcmA (bactofilin family)